MDENSVVGVADFTCIPISSQNRRCTDIGYCIPDIMHLIGLAASAMSDHSRMWCQMRLILTSKLGVFNVAQARIVRSKRLHGFDTWTSPQADASIYGSETRTIVKADAKQLRAIRVRCQRRIIGTTLSATSENKNSTRLTRRDNSEATCLLLHIARLGREDPTDQAPRIAADVRDGVVVTVVAEIPGCSESPLTR